MKMNYPQPAYDVSPTLSAMQVKLIITLPIQYSVCP